MNMTGPVSVVKWVILIVQENGTFQRAVGGVGVHTDPVEAKKVLDEKLSHYQKEDWEKVWSLLKNYGEIQLFYHEHFHTLKEEYKK